jgi:signal recognition particle receptor subunit beta
MVQINFGERQVTAKIVYYGPGMSGKTTNIEVVHQKAPPGNRGELTSISTDGDRTLFFDFMPLDLGTVAGLKTSFQIYTVPGQVYYNSTRKLVLQGVDGVVFVADSSATMVEENLESLRNLEQNLAEYGKDAAEIPLVIQYNKRDLPDALPFEELERLLNPRGVPSFEAVANTGQGVFPTLKALASIVIQSIHSGTRSNAAPSAPQPAFGAPAPAIPSAPVASAAMPAPVSIPAPLAMAGVSAAKSTPVEAVRAPTPPPAPRPLAEPQARHEPTTKDPLSATGLRPVPIELSKTGIRPLPLASAAAANPRASTATPAAINPAATSPAAAPRSGLQPPRTWSAPPRQAAPQAPVRARNPHLGQMAAAPTPKARGLFGLGARELALIALALVVGAAVMHFAGGLL